MAKTVVFVKGVLERKKFQIFLAKTDAHVRWVVKEKSFRFFRPNGDFCPVGSDEKKFQIFLAKTVVSVKGVLEDEKVSDSFVQNGTSCPLGSEGKKLPKKRTTSPVFVKGVLKRKSFGFFRSKRSELSRGYWREKSFRTFWPNSPFSSSGYRGEKVSEKADHFTGFCPVSIEGRIFQNLSFKTGKTLQWVVERRNFRKPSVLALRRGYQMRERKFSLKT